MYGLLLIDDKNSATEALFKDETDFNKAVGKCFDVDLIFKEDFRVKHIFKIDYSIAAKAIQDKLDVIKDKITAAGISDEELMNVVLYKAVQSVHNSFMNKLQEDGGIGVDRDNRENSFSFSSEPLDIDEVKIFVKMLL